MLRRMNTKANWPCPCREHWKQQGNKAMAFGGQRSGLRSTPTRLSRNVRGSTDCLTIHMRQTCFTSVEATGLQKKAVKQALPIWGTGSWASHMGESLRDKFTVPAHGRMEQKAQVQENRPEEKNRTDTVRAA